MHFDFNWKEVDPISLLPSTLGPITKWIEHRHSWRFNQSLDTEVLSDFWNRKDILFEIVQNGFSFFIRWISCSPSCDREQDFQIRLNSCESAKHQWHTVIDLGSLSVSRRLWLTAFEVKSCRIKYKPHSCCQHFVLREDMFWRFCDLSYCL